MKAILITAIALSSCLTAADHSALIRLYEDEVFAHDLYTELAKAHPEIRPLQHIPASEAHHREVMAGLLAREGIALPEVPAGRHFASDGLDALFDQWLAEGRQSPQDACHVGVRLEEADIAELRRAQRDYPAHQADFAALESASGNHLRAFHRNLVVAGGRHEPTALPADEFQAIVTATGNGCRGAAAGCGQSRHQGQRGRHRHGQSGR